jgi:hypothetical protein
VVVHRVGIGTKVGRRQVHRRCLTHPVLLPSPHASRPLTTRRQTRGKGAACAPLYWPPRVPRWLTSLVEPPERALPGAPERDGVWLRSASWVL